MLRARPASGPVGAPSPSLVTSLAVGGAGQLHAVIGGVHHGVRIDVAGNCAALPLDRLIFPFTVAIRSRQFAEFRRLVAFARGRPLAERAETSRLYRIILALRVIDALGEGASLRTIGETFVRARDWPGRGESTKSAARRLAGFARQLWSHGPAAILSGPSRLY